MPVFIKFFLTFCWAIISLHDLTAAVVNKDLGDKGLRLLRLGTTYGGWTIPDIFSSESTCYCIGAGEDISFDVELAKRYGCNVHIIDPTPRALEHFNYVKRVASEEVVPFTQLAKKAPYDATPTEFEKLHFLPIGIWDTDGIMRFYSPQNPTHVSHSVLNTQSTTAFFEAPCKKIKTIMRRLGHVYIDLLKLDIEGAEYRVLDDVIKDGVAIGVFCVEFHDTRQHKKSAALDFLDKRGFEVMFQEGSNITFKGGR